MPPFQQIYGLEAVVTSAVDIIRGLAGMMGMMIGVMVVFFIISILLCVWVYKDAEARGKSGALWLIIVLIAGLIGLIIWLMVRPKEKISKPE